MRRYSLAALLAVIVFAGLLPAGVTAAPVMTFGLEGDGLMLRSNCVGGRGPINAAVHVVWKSAGGSVKAAVDLTTGSGGSWGYCSPSNQLRVGDTIRATSGSSARTFTMRDVTLNGNRVTHRFSGIGLPGATGDLWFHSGIFADFYENYQVVADSQGHWSFPDGAYGGIDATIDWVTTQGDWLHAAILVPYVDVTIGRATTEGGSSALSAVSVNLRDPATNALRGRATATSANWGFFSGSFRDAAGDLVAVRVGDRVVSPIASSLDWHVPEITGSADVANDLVAGKCFSTEIEANFAVARVYRTGEFRGIAISDVDANGEFTMDFGRTEPDLMYDPANIKHGDRIRVSCYYDTYDIVNFAFRVP